MKTLVDQFVLETKLLSRDTAALFWAFAFPVFFIALYGLLYGDTMWDEVGMRAIDFVVPGIVVLAVMVTGIMFTANAFIEEREKGIYRRLSLTPVRRSVIIGGQLVNRYLIILVQTALLLVVAAVFFETSITGNFLYLWLAVTIGALCFVALGFALTAAIKNQKSATPFTLIIFFVMLMLGSVLYPIDIVPGFLQHVSNILPSTHLNNAIRLVIIEGAGLGEVARELPVLVGWTIAGLAVAIRFFKWE